MAEGCQGPPGTLGGGAGGPWQAAAAGAGVGLELLPGLCLTHEMSIFNVCSSWQTMSQSVNTAVFSSVL